MSSPYNNPHYPEKEPQNNYTNSSQEDTSQHSYSTQNDNQEEYTQSQWNSTTNDGDNQREYAAKERKNDATAQERQNAQWMHHNNKVNDKYANNLYDNQYAYQYASQHSVPQQKKSNWPQFLIDSSAQQLYGFLALGIGLATGGLVGLIMSCYYLFLLDDSVEKDSTAKVLNWISFWIPVGAFLLMLIFLFGFIIMGTSLAAFVPQRMGLFVT